MTDILNGKNILVGVCGGIAAYKACELVSSLKKRNCDIKVIMTKNSMQFVSELTYKTLSQNEVITDMFNYEGWMPPHIAAAKKADLIIILPATANIIAKLNAGIADDMLSTTLLAATCPVLICPSMNVNMYESASVCRNIKSLKERGYTFVEPQSGFLACGDSGKGRLPDTDIIISHIERQFIEQDYKGKTVMVTAGATIEDIDGIRFITNPSSGKMGCETARAARDRGADVILIAGRITAPVPYGVEVIYTQTTEDMRDAVMNNLQRADIVIKAAAPSDYKISNRENNKIKSENLILKLEKTPDIAKSVGEVKGNKKLVIFCAETEKLIQNAEYKLHYKNADLIVANDVKMEGAGFNTDTNIVSIIDNKFNKQDYPIMSKYQVANIILDKIKEL